MLGAKRPHVFKRLEEMLETERRNKKCGTTESFYQEI